PSAPARFPAVPFPFPCARPDLAVFCCPEHRPTRALSPPPAPVLEARQPAATGMTGAGQLRVGYGGGLAGGQPARSARQARALVYGRDGERKRVGSRRRPMSAGRRVRKIAATPGRAFVVAAIFRTVRSRPRACATAGVNRRFHSRARS